MKILFALLTLFSTLPAHAGLYVKAFGGANYLDHQIGWQDQDWQSNTGYVVGGALGTSLAILSLETEVALRRNTIKSNETDINTDNIYSLDGTVEKWTLIENLLISLPFHSVFVPYFGAGVGGGYDQTQLDVYLLNEFGPNLLASQKNRKLGTVVQALAGFSLNFIPMTSLSFEYRFLSSFDMREQKNHAGTASLRFGF